ncbi:MAG: GspMb/PilO family protein [Candidatus Omnitrophota bacterium]|nr:hypothetical protein [Candidatus Omnitrophota bacterium]
MKKISIQQIYTSLSHLSTREKIVLYVTIAVVSVMVLDRLIVAPVVSRIRSLNKEITDAQHSVVLNSRIVAQKDRILVEGAKYVSFLSSDKTEEEETTALLKDLEAIATGASVYLSDMKPAAAKVEGPAIKYMVTLTCEGQMDQIIDFIYNVESSKKLLVIEKYEIIPKSKESSTAQASMTISKTVIP